MRERRAGVGLGRGEREGRGGIQANEATFALKVRTTRCVYHLLLQLVVLPADQYRSFLENWGEKTQRRLSLACERLPGGRRLEESKCIRCRLVAPQQRTGSNYENN